MTHLVVAMCLAHAACRERANPKDEPPPSRMKATEPSQAKLDTEAAGAPDWKSALKYDVRFDGARGGVAVGLDIAPGFHAYTVGETIGRPLKVEIAADSPLKLDGEVQYPAGTTKDLPLGRSVIVEGKSEVFAPTAVEPGKKVKGSFHYQVCTNDACDRPRTVPFELEAS